MKKGFTLIELLAVIVILAVIALIATPTILSIINRARKGEAEVSMLNYVETIEKQFMLELVNDASFTPQGTYTVQGKVLSKDAKEIKLELKGDTPKNDVESTVEVNSIGQVKVANLKFGDYYVHYEFKENNVKYCSNRKSFKTCEGEEIDTPTPSEETKPKVYKTGKTSEVSVIYFNPVENKSCTVKEYNTDLESYKKNNVKTTPTGQKTGCMKWYAIENSGEDKSTVDVLLDHNITENVTWKSKESYVVDETGWSENLNARFITANEIAHIVGADREETIKWDSNTANVYKDFYFDGSGTTYSEWKTQVATGNGTSKYAWLYNYIKDCEGCEISGSSSIGYWTSTTVTDFSTYAWCVFRTGLLEGRKKNSSFGIRPVITINKDLLN